MNYEDYQVDGSRLAFDGFEKPIGVAEYKLIVPQKIAEAVNR